MSISPASPPCRIVSFSPLSCSNAALTSFGIANESWVTSTTSLLPLPEPPQPAATTASTAANAPTSSVPAGHTDSSRSGPGWTASRQPRATLTTASVAAKTFETPRLVPAGRVSSRSGYSSPLVVTPSAGPCTGSSETSLAGRARQGALAADHPDAVVVEVRIDRGARIALVAEQQERAEQVVEPAAARCRSRGCVRARARLRRRARARGRSRPWRRGCRSIAAPAASAAASPAGETESKSPIARSMRSPSASARSMPESAAITKARSGRSAARQGRDALRQRRRRSRAPRAYLRWHYPDQVLRVGGALSRPLSPVVPELPVSLAPS